MDKNKNIEILLELVATLGISLPLTSFLYHSALCLGRWQQFIILISLMVGLAVGLGIRKCYREFWRVDHGEYPSTTASGLLTGIGWGLGLSASWYLLNCCVAGKLLLVAIFSGLFIPSETPEMAKKSLGIRIIKLLPVLAIATLIILFAEYWPLGHHR